MSNRILKTKEQLLKWLLFLLVALPACTTTIRPAPPGGVSPYAPNPLIQKIVEKDTAFILSYKTEQEGFWDEKWELLRMATSEINAINMTGGGDAPESLTFGILIWKLETDSCTIIRKEQYGSMAGGWASTEFFRCRNDSIYAGGKLELLSSKPQLFVEQTSYYRQLTPCAAFMNGESFPQLDQSNLNSRTWTIYHLGKPTCSHSSSKAFNSWGLERKEDSIVMITIRNDSNVTTKGTCPPNVYVEIE